VARHAARLGEFLRLYTGITPEIVELGLAGAAPRSDAFKFTVRLRVPDPTQVDRAVVEASSKPRSRRTPATRWRLSPLNGPRPKLKYATSRATPSGCCAKIHPRTAQP